MDAANFASLGWFNVLISLLLILLGWLLNRVFNEIDALKKADQHLAKEVHELNISLPTSYFTKDDFNRHEQEEKEWISEFRKEVRLSLERIHIRLDALNHNAHIKPPTEI